MLSHNIPNYDGEYRDDAIEEMLDWFHNNFEDPNEATPFESGEYLFIAGGPFEAEEVIREEFDHVFPEPWIEEVIDEIESSGIQDWAPDYWGEFALRDEPSGYTNAASKEKLRDEILNKIASIESLLEETPVFDARVGHNNPPEDIGVPPYDENKKIQISVSLNVLKHEIAKEASDNKILDSEAKRLRKISLVILKYFGLKMDLVIEESLKMGVKAGAFLILANQLKSLVLDILRFINLGF